MSTALAALLGFALWTLALVVVGIGSVRVGAVLTGKAKPNDFPADVPHGGERYRRVIRAHLNCVENLPIFATVVLAAAVVGLRSGTFDALAVVVLGARVCQSLVHIASGRNLAINVRFVFFLTQIACFVAMGWMVATG